MRLTRILLAALLFALCAPLCFGQGTKGGAAKSGRPDFSGTWTFDQSRSNIGPRGPRNSSAGADWTIVISHREPEVTVEETIVTDQGTSELHSVQYTDGRPVERKPYRCKSKWDKTRLVRKCENLEPHDDGDNYRFTERWELSADGRTLTQRISLPRPRAPRDAFGRLPPGLLEGVERERTVREILEPSRDIIKVFRRVS